MGLRRFLARSALAACVAATAATAAPHALAQGSPGAAGGAQAEALYQDAKRLMGEGKYEEACPKLEESQRLDPGGGTLLNLAVCHEKIGKIATAWAEFNEALTAAKRDGRDDRQKLAKERIDVIAPKLPRLTISVPAASNAEGLAIKLDGFAIGRASYGTAMPVDPGAHTVTAEAPGRKKREASVEVKEGAAESFEVPVLEAEMTAAPPQPVVAPPITTAIGPGPMRPGGDQPSGGGSALKVAGFVVGGVGIAAAAVGAVFGAKAISTWNDSNANCANEKCNAAGVELARDAKQSATIANIGVFVGGTAIVAGTTLLIIGAIKGSGEPAKQGRTAPAKRAAFHAEPDAFFDTKSGGLSLRGVF